MKFQFCCRCAKFGKYGYYVDGGEKVGAVEVVIVHFILYFEEYVCSC